MKFNILRGRKSRNNSTSSRNLPSPPAPSTTLDKQHYEAQLKTLNNAVDTLIGHGKKLEMEKEAQRIAYLSIRRALLPLCSTNGKTSSTVVKGTESTEDLVLLYRAKAVVSRVVSQALSEVRV